ncbi:DUF732 domain-containing protein [Mycobacterium malmoense]|uniref:DUF732 domain-containing protein n=1 Tax=Mycobacterium malmoense TaxID=1780 RepID=UPI0009F59CFE|nr:DUF732 domain-containing protein [Mycobacterium malmoense]
MTTDEDPTAVEPTQVAEALPAEQVLAWQDEPDEPQEERTGSGRTLIAVAVLAMLACGIAVLTAVVVLVSPKPQPEQFSLRPPLEVLPPPAPKTALPPPAPPPVAKPPTAAPRPVNPPTPETPPFITALNADGIGISEPGAAITDAHIACANLGRGIAKSVVVAEVKQNTSNYTDADAADFVDLSTAFYCPQYSSR